MNGQLIVEGRFVVLHKELRPDSRISLTLGDETRRVHVDIPFEVLQEIESGPTSASIRRTAELAENRVIERLRL
ncbi:MAG TPA: hypothetical protein VGX00_08885 [Thermoplasmata archaeon]|nr:hypothetical protein [Thermoplasmata archaeon]